MAAALTFADLLAPLSAERFFETHHGRQWAHVEGDRARFAELLSWDRFDALLSNSAIWTAESLRLYRRGALVPAAEYCGGEGEGGGTERPRPLPGAVMAQLRQGAALMAGQMDTASPGIAAIADALEAELGAKVGCGAAFASRGNPMRSTHYEVHDLYMLQLEGEQRWRLFENRIEAPVTDVAFPRPDPGANLRLDPGAEQATVTTTPGDLLYLPRGVFHDAVPTAGDSLHLAFGVQAFTGREFLRALIVQTVYDPVFRRDFPRAAEGETALRERLQALGQQIRDTAADPGFVTRFAEYQQTMRTERGAVRLPVEDSGIQQGTQSDGNAD